MTLPELAALQTTPLSRSKPMKLPLQQPTDRFGRSDQSRETLRQSSSHSAEELDLFEQFLNTPTTSREPSAAHHQAGQEEVSKRRYVHTQSLSPSTTGPDSTGEHIAQSGAATETVLSQPMQTTQLERQQPGGDGNSSWNDGPSDQNEEVSNVSPSLARTEHNLHNTLQNRDEGKCIPETGAQCADRKCSKVSKTEERKVRTANKQTGWLQQFSDDSATGANKQSSAATGKGFGTVQQISNALSGTKPAAASGTAYSTTQLEVSLTADYM